MSQRWPLLQDEREICIFGKLVYDLRSSTLVYTKERGNGHGKRAGNVAKLSALEEYEVVPTMTQAAEVYLDHITALAHW